MPQGGYYQGLLGAQGALADIEAKRLRGQVTRKELEEFETNAPFRQALQQEQLKEVQSRGPLRKLQGAEIGQKMRGNELEMLGKAKELFTSVGDPQQLEQANAQFEQFTGRPSPYRGKPFTPDFRERVTNDLMSVEQRLKMQLAREKGQSERGKPLTGSELLHYKNAEGQPPPPGSTLQQLQTGGYKLMGTAEQTSQLAGRGAEATIGQLENLVSRVWGEPGKEKVGTGLMGRAVSGGQFLQQRLRQSNPDLVLFESFGAGTLAPLIRAIGEKGNLAEGDIRRAIELIPKTGNRIGTLPDTAEVARGKMQQLRNWFDTALGKTQTGGQQAPAYGRRGGDKLKLNPDGTFTYSP